MCVYTCVYTMHTYIYMDGCVYTYIGGCVYISMHTHTPLYMYTHIHIYIYRYAWYEHVRLPVYKKKCNTARSCERQFLEMLLDGRGFLLCHPYLWDIWLSIGHALTAFALVPQMAYAVCPAACRIASMAWLFLAASWLRCCEWHSWFQGLSKIVLLHRN